MKVYPTIARGRGKLKESVEWESRKEANSSNQYEKPSFISSVSSECEA
jgi:hypothetical protein